MKTERQKLMTRVINAQKRLGVMMATIASIDGLSDSEITLVFDQRQLGIWKVVSNIEKVSQTASEGN